MRRILIVIFSHLIIATSYADNYQQMIDSSYVAIEADSLVKAEVYLKKAMRIEPANPNNYILLSNLGTIQRTLGKHDDAILSYSSALMLAPKSDRKSVV